MQGGLWALLYVLLSVRVIFFFLWFNDASLG